MMVPDKYKNGMQKPPDHPARLWLSKQHTTLENSPKTRQSVVIRPCRLKGL